jgi:hypothetical protein
LLPSDTGRPPALEGISVVVREHNRDEILAGDRNNIRQRADYAGCNRQARFVCRAAPAPGFRDSGNFSSFGALRDVGGSGYSWSSTIPPGSGNAHFLNFYTGGSSSQGNDHRAYGFQLRCLQE